MSYALKRKLPLRSVSTGAIIVVFSLGVLVSCQPPANSNGLSPYSSAERREERPREAQPRERGRDQGSEDRGSEDQAARSHYQNENGDYEGKRERRRRHRHQRDRGRDDDERSQNSNGDVLGQSPERSPDQRSGRYHDRDNNQTATSLPPSAQADGGSRDLSKDEAAGGHILRKHVGQSDDDLRQRMQRETRITGASTYTDRPTAERAVGAAISQSHDRIERWLSGSSHQNLVLDYDSPTPVGRTINRGESAAHPCGHAVVVLKYSGANNYYVLTSYPECR